MMSSERVSEDLAIYPRLDIQNLLCCQVCFRCHPQGDMLEESFLYSSLDEHLTKFSLPQM